MWPKRKTGSIAILVVTVVALAVLVFFVSTGSLAPRSFAIDCAIVMIVATFTWIWLLKAPSEIPRLGVRQGVRLLEAGTTLRLFKLLYCFSCCFFLLAYPWRDVGTAVDRRFYACVISDRYDSAKKPSKADGPLIFVDPTASRMTLWRLVSFSVVV